MSFCDDCFLSCVVVVVVVVGGGGGGGGVIVDRTCDVFLQ